MIFDIGKPKNVFSVDYLKSPNDVLRFGAILDSVYNPFEKYGVRRVINAATSMTMLGGSISPPEVFRAMEDASRAFVRIPELQHWAGKILADATGAEGGLPTAGAGNGIMLAAAACIMRGTALEKYDPLKQETWTSLTQKLPLRTEGLRTGFVVQKSNRNVYDHNVECAGGRFIEVGTSDATSEAELHDAFDPAKVCAYYFTVRPSYKGLPLETVIKVAHHHGVPVIVDAASELPPKDNLRRYISRGADLVIFSGGKFIAGPNNSGILVGKRNLIKLAHLQAYPFHGVGRAAKLSRETIVGLVAALRIYFEQDFESLFKSWESKAEWIAKQLDGIPGLEVGLTCESTVEDGTPMVPLCYLKVDEKAIGMSGRELSEKLREGDPSIEAPYEPAFLIEDFKDKITINPEFMLEGDEQIVVDRVRQILRKAKPSS